MSRDIFVGVLVILFIEPSQASLEAIVCITRPCVAPPPNCYYVKDANGCPSCKMVCNRADCPDLNCTQPCYNGYVKGIDGCNTCYCQKGCYERICPGGRICPSGYLSDRRGCPTCQCKPQALSCHQKMLCPEGACPNSCSCEPHCYVEIESLLGGTPSTIEPRPFKDAFINQDLI
ncbi:unnamed protein product [Lymnaea stagnalis]|uniref:Antistasin-like domain-containing protein n=1 Tax=Lymnaea stagnalis TaxID=6523 RepID=A0AAV2H1D8_LYMST